MANQVLVGFNGTNFAPSMLTVEAGTSVQWLWVASGHTVTSGTVVGGQGVADNNFCSPNDMNCATNPTGNAGDTYMHTFVEAGTYPYFCRPHAGNGMVGTINVQ